MTKKLLSATLVALGCLGAFSATLAADDPAPSASVNIASKSIAAGVGVSWGDGTLNYHGERHTFSIDGLSVMDLGISSITTSGEVYNLNNVSDFSGNYAAGAAGLALAGGANDVIMKNDHGVVIRLHGTEKGIRLQLAAQGITIKLKS